MADEAVSGQGQHEEAAEQPARRGRGLFRAIRAIAFVSVIVVVEIVVASMIAPTAQETERLAQELVAASAGESSDGHDAEAEHEEHGSGHGLHEVELGMYNVTRFNPSTNTTLAIDFELFGTVLAEDEGEFHHLYENSKARIREAVNMTLHGTDSTNLSDAGLGLIKRQILEKTNRALGEPVLKEVLFSKFNFVER